ncbi:Rv3235 family protein [Actinomadura oligospora]|uniref:Rv3235 family protein n=1 Tax=Actinomadura oligospora TaxID=111804 RepID=UPI00047ACEF3|nr:Rv3235 family protein [Actinomadura oligospora]
MGGRDVRCGKNGASATAGNLALDVVAAPSRVPLRVLPGGGEPSAVGARQVAAQVVHLLLEALAGKEVLGHQEAAVSGPVAVPQVLSCWVQQPGERAAEGGAVVLFRGRVHALAIRMELRHGRWRCTELETTALDPNAVPDRPRTSHKPTNAREHRR